MNVKKFFLGLSTALCFTASAFAAPITFTVDSVIITPGTGYGTGSEEKLDVSFAAVTGIFGTTLDMAATKVWQFKIGTVELKELCINPGGCPKPSGTNAGPAGDETDELTVGVTMHFASPLGNDVSVTLIGDAKVGMVNDSATDYTLKFSNKEVDFGNGGKFDLDFSDLNFTNLNQPRDLTATVTLLQAPVTPPANDVPEPESLALVGLGLAGLVFRGKRRQA